jgi:hypothetical protein
VFVQKARAGSDSYGNHWPVDGHVLDLPTEQAVDLLSIPDGGFSAATAAEPPPPPPPGGEADDDPADDTVPAEVLEPAPAAPTAVTEPAPKRTTTRKPARKD